MSGYQRINFKDQNVERPKTYDVTNNPDGSITLIDSFGNVEELGTPINSETMGHIEDALEEHDDRITILENATDYDNFLNKSQITNCILEIPQNIKYELNDGELTINAGSIVTINGEDYVIQSVPTVNAGTSTTQAFIIYEKTRNMLLACTPSTAGSGTALPTDGSSYAFFFNTTDKKVYRWVNNAWNANAGYSLPLMIVTRSGVANQFASIDQVFNGFGYIGSTLWCDKGVKVLIPNGKNSDGTLKNIEYTTPKVITGTLKDARSNTYFCLRNGGILSLHTNLKYNENSNYNYIDGVGNINGVPFAIGATTTNGVITKYKSLTNAVYLADVNKTVSKLGDTMTGTLTSEANNGAEIHIKGDDSNGWLTIKGTSSKYDYNDYQNVPTENLRNLRLISYDKNGVYYFYQQVSAEPNRNICAFQVNRKLTDGTVKNCMLALRVQDTGVNTLLINGKPLQAFVVETYKNGTSWYRVYSDGWIEQGGVTTTNFTNAVTLLKSFSDTNYSVFLTKSTTTNQGNYENLSAHTRTTTSVIISSGSIQQEVYWMACGY